MRLSDYFIPLTALVQANAGSTTLTPEALAEQIDALIQQAQSRALQNEVSLDDFQAALFAMLAWADETISRRHHWPSEHAWQKHLLQRRYFKTGLAGREFFDRLEALPAGETQIREVFLLCLALGFKGKYSMFPNSADLANIRMEQYKLLQKADPAWRAAGETALFPNAYGLGGAGAPGRAGKPPMLRRLTWRRALIFLLPPLIVIVVALVLHAELTNAVQHFREVADL